MKSLIFGFSIQRRIMNLNYYYLVNEMLAEKAFLLIVFFCTLLLFQNLFQIFGFSSSNKSFWPFQIHKKFIRIFKLCKHPVTVSNYTLDRARNECLCINTTRVIIYFLHMVQVLLSISDTIHQRTVRMLCYFRPSAEEEDLLSLFACTLVAAIQNV